MFLYFSYKLYQKCLENVRLIDSINFQISNFSDLLLREDYITLRNVDLANLWNE